jgi:hypothetical protein
VREVAREAEEVPGPGLRGAPVAGGFETAPLALQRRAVDRAVRRVLSRKVASNYADLASKLTTGWTDWEVTDSEAIDVFSALHTLLLKKDKRDFFDTVSKLQADGHLGTLLVELPSDWHTTFASAVDRIEEIRDDRLTDAQRLQYRHCADIATAADADNALKTLQAMDAVDRVQLMDVMDTDNWEAFSKLLPKRTDRVELKFLMELEMLFRQRTLSDLRDMQKAFIASEAAAAGKSVEDYLAGEAATRGYGGTAVEAKSAAYKRRWAKKAEDAVAKIKAAAPVEIKALIAAAEIKGGGIKYDYETVERNDAYAVHSGDWLLVGKSWVETALKDPANVYENIAHELGGHEEYGDEMLWDVMVLATTSAERTAAGSHGRSLYTAYGYMETEIYAELRELPYRTAGSQGDEPAEDVEGRLKEVKAAFAPRVANVWVRAFRRRISHDATITAAALALFDDKVKALFGIAFR